MEGIVGACIDPSRALQTVILSVSRSCIIVLIKRIFSHIRLAWSRAVRQDCGRSCEMRRGLGTWLFGTLSIAVSDDTAGRS